MLQNIKVDESSAISMAHNIATLDADQIKSMVRRLAQHCAKYKGAVPSLAYKQIASTIIPLAVVVAAMFATVDVAYWATLLLALPASGLLVRLFIIQHDCGHGSFLPTQKANHLVGRLASVLTMAPYGLWRREHAQHHAGSGNLDRRGAGDIETVTVREYKSMSRLEKLRYRLYRNPLFLFGFGVPFYFMVIQRFPWFHALPAKDSWKSVMGLNAGLILFYAPLIYVFGFLKVAMVVLPIVHFASAIGGWLFFIQHQFEETHWEEGEDWDFQVAAVMGSSYYALPPILNWFTGNIGLHHIHHLNSTIPNYRLKDCLAASPELQSINKLTLWDSFKCAKLKLWDEDNRQLVGFSAAH